MKDTNPVSSQSLPDLLCPVFLYWLRKLDQNIRYLDDGDTKFLFCARAGLRIDALYSAFLEENDLSKPPSEIFWISRLAICKGVFARAPQAVCDLLASEFADDTLADVLECLLKDAPDVWSEIAPHHSALHDRPSKDLFVWITSNDPASKRVHGHLSQLSAEFDGYLASARGSAKRLVLIDSGWKATSQSLLAQAYPDLDFYGLYFGIMPSGGLHASIAQKAVGCVFEGDTYDPDRPETAFSQHRHMIEATLETNAPSLQRAPRTQESATQNPDVAANLSEVPDPAKDATYLALLDMIRARARHSLTDVHVGFRAAVQELSEQIMFPSAADAERLWVKARSADLGRALSVPDLSQRSKEDDRGTAQRVDEALWRQGQIALEHPPAVAKRMQETLAAQSNAESYFVARSPELVEVKTYPLVAVITRTKDRPIMLARAARSVAQQTYPNYIWVVVNDGGDPATVDSVVQNSIADMRRTVVLHQNNSQGMEAASNIGISAVSADYVLLHDDDDTIAPDFLDRTVAFLEDGAGQKYGGVITQSVLVTETLTGDALVEHKREVYNAWVSDVQLAEMATGNFFPPIAFLYRRALWEEIGGYDESLPVLGDWLFNLEFLSRADIGMVSEPLAFYHQRLASPSGSAHTYANSVVLGQSLHKEYDAIVRNKLIRNQAGNPVLASLIAGAYLHKATRSAAGRMAPSPPPPVPCPREVDTQWVISNCVGGTKWSRLVRVMARLCGGFLPERSQHRLSHYLIRKGAAVEPEPSFDETAYVAQNDDVQSGIALGTITSGYIHYVMHGREEGRERPRQTAP